MNESRRSFPFRRESPAGKLELSPRNATPPWLLAALLAAFLFFATNSWAQKDTGGIAGTVKDASGAVVADAKVHVTDVDRGESCFLSDTDGSVSASGPARLFLATTGN